MSLCKISKLIEQKRKGLVLSKEEIGFFVNHLCGPANAVDPCQIGAMLMAIYLKGFNQDETKYLTRSMKESGYTFTWPESWRQCVVDKHSTGGVGDKVSLVLAPALAAVGLKVPMISGRSLGHTGGTLDKMESIPGFRVELTSSEIIDAVVRIGCCIVGQADDIVPADRILYRCRDLTATVNHQSLVTASIVSKKLAEGIDSLVYDVKFGKGAFFNSQDEALKLAEALVLASSDDSKCSAFLTCMDSPVGSSIGNTLEVLEAVHCLRGHGSMDLLELVQELGAELLCLTNLVQESTEGKRLMSQVIENGEALRKFYELIVNQGVSEEIAGKLCYGNAEEALPTSKHVTDIKYQGLHGYVGEIDAMILADFCRDVINSVEPKNLTAGLTIRKHVGEQINTGDVWLQVHHDEPALDGEHVDILCSAIIVKDDATRSRRRVYKKLKYANKGIDVQSVYQE